MRARAYCVRDLATVRYLLTSTDTDLRTLDISFTALELIKCLRALCGRSDAGTATGSS